jgi:hypothetical protein
MFNKCISVLAVLMLLILTGCGGGSSKPAKTADTSDDDDDKAKTSAPKADAPKKEKAAGGAAEAYDEKKATATIKGVVALDGTPPKMAKIAVGDEACKNHRASGGQEAIEREDVVSKDGKLANVLVYVTKGHEKYDFGSLKLPNVQIDQKGCQYAPHVLAVMVDQALDIKSSDPIAHNIHILFPGDEKNIAQSTPGISASHPKFGEARTGVTVKCDVHAWMKAYLNVIDNPFFAVTGVDGKFEFKLPPGKYEISTWHESDAEGNKKWVEGPAAQTVDVTADKPAELTLTYKVK